MDNPRFYTRIPLSPAARLELPEPVARHAVRVLRLGVGAEITLFDGRGGEYPATIEHIEKDRVTVRLGNWLARECESPLSLTLVQAVQAADKMDFTLQKAVELGIAAFYPVTSRRSVVRLTGERAARRVAHWQGVAASACEQCGRNQIPAIGNLESVEQWLARPAPGSLRLLLSPESSDTLPGLPPPAAIQLLVGAEGGLDPVEIAAARSAGFIAVRLGPRILRTETAGLAALAALQTLWGDWR